MPSERPAPAILKFGVFQVDARTGELFKHGIRIKIQDQPFQVLLMLLEKSGEVVTREELRQRLWSEQTFVDFDHSLNIAVNKLRDALGDSAENPRFVETLPKRGYRFLAPVTVEDLAPRPAAAPATVATPAASIPKLETGTWEGRASSDEIHTAQRRLKLYIFAAVFLVAAAIAGWRWAAGRGAPLAGKLMLAVLPLENLSGDAKQDYFISGLHDEMISQLGRMHSTRLGVIARTSVLQYAATRKSIQEIGRDLRVDYVLEGTVRRAQDRVRIAVQLVKVSDQTPMWSEQYERMVADVIEIQTDVARRVAAALSLQLLPDERTAMERASTSNMGAYEDYLRGRFNLNRRSEDGFLQAIVYFEDAARKDPKFALAYAGLADCYNLMGGYAFQPPSQAFPKAKAAAARALELKPDLAEARAALAFSSFYFDWNWNAAEGGFKNAIDANPNYAPARQWYAEFLHAMGRFDEADAQFRRALELDPFSLPLNDDLGWLMLSRAQNDAAIAQFRKTQALDPDWTSGYTSLAFALARAGQHTEAFAELERLKQRKGESGAYLEALGYVQALAGQKSNAEATLAVLSRRAGVTPTSPYSMALIRVALGDPQTALAELNRGFVRREPWLVWLRTHPEWQPLQSEPEFQSLLRRIGLAP